MIKDLTELSKMVMVILLWLGLYSLAFEGIAAYKVNKAIEASECFPRDSESDDVEKDVDMSLNV